MSISENIQHIKEKLNIAMKNREDCLGEVMLIGVSKTQPIQSIEEARLSGITVFGENKVQELLEKYEKVQGVSWHLIGHLQKNKVKYIVDKVDMIHSLDSVELAAEIDKRAKKINRKIPVLIQINIGREPSKSGIFEEEAGVFLDSLKKFENILVSGIMTIPPASDNKEQARTYFKKMRIIFEELKRYNYGNIQLEYLSMGMSGDFEIAVEEGANIVRVGTGIFGERVYN
jgi:PLP dependent protein